MDRKCGMPARIPQPAGHSLKPLDSVCAELSFAALLALHDDPAAELCHPLEVLRRNSRVTLAAREHFEFGEVLFPTSFEDVPGPSRERL